MKIITIAPSYEKHLAGDARPASVCPTGRSPESLVTPQRHPNAAGRRRRSRSFAVDAMFSDEQLAAAVFHGKKGELYERYHKGMEDQLGALGLV